MFCFSFAACIHRGTEAEATQSNFAQLREYNRLLLLLPIYPVIRSVEFVRLTQV
jgi:hypothetical protein